MPNHVETHVTIIGPPEALDQIAALATAETSILEHYLPLPADATEERHHTAADGTPYTTNVFTDSGYTTAVDLWGSKWADYDVWLVADERHDPQPHIVIHNNSAWSPVVEGYRKLSESLGIVAVLRYRDEGDNFVGATAVADGRIVSQQDLVFDALDAYVKANGCDPEPPDFDSDEWGEWRADYDALVYDATDTCETKVTDDLLSVLEPVG